MSPRGAALLLAAVAAAIAIGWGIGQAREAPPRSDDRADSTPAPVRSPRPTRTATPTATPSPAPRRAFDAAARRDFDRLSAQLGGTIGLAVAPVGRAKGVESLGTWHGGVAWSTIKPAVTMAVIDAGLEDEVARADARLAITVSDNDAADRLWDRLGGGAAAAAATKQELASAGDTRTAVPSEFTRPGFSVSGQTHWRLTDQARFAAALRCTTSGRTVLRLMRQVQPDQRWGLGTLSAGAAIKGGWGPGLDGRYLVRQMGVVRLSGAPLAVALATEPADGAFGTGTANLTTLAHWIAEHAHPIDQRPAC